MSGTLIKIVLDLSHSCDAVSNFDSRYPKFTISVHQTCDNVDYARVLLGIGVVLQAAVVLRYISYFEQFNVILSELLWITVVLYLLNIF